MQEITSLARSLMLRKYLKVFNTNLDSYNKKSFDEWQAKQWSPEVRLFQGHEPLRKDELRNLLNRLVPDWDRRRRLFQVRLKTILRIYISKWFYKGLDWNEIELLEILYTRFPDLVFPLFEHREILTFRGFEFVNNLGNQAEDDPLKGLQVTFFLGNVQDLLFTEVDFNAVWKLSSVQALRDYIFLPMDQNEHEGKIGIRRNRIRGYRDGKASPRDPRLTQLARQLDQLFYEKKFESRWEKLFSEIKDIGDMVQYVRTYYDLLYKKSTD